MIRNPGGARTARRELQRGFLPIFVGTGSLSSTRLLVIGAPTPNGGCCRLSRHEARAQVQTARKSAEMQVETPEWMKDRPEYWRATSRRVDIHIS
jgi:hypothetical protein